MIKSNYVSKYRKTTQSDIIILVECIMLQSTTYTAPFWCSSERCIPQYKRAANYRGCWDMVGAVPWYQYSCFCSLKTLTGIRRMEAFRLPGLEVKVEAGDALILGPHSRFGNSGMPWLYRRVEPSATYTRKNCNGVTLPILCTGCSCHRITWK